MTEAIECTVWWATPLPPDAAYLSLLNEPERGRYDAYRQPIDQRRFLTGRVLARTVAGQHLGVPPEQVELDATCPDCDKPHGKPRVPDSDLDLSISHSGDRIGLAVTTGVPVGLDVESRTRTVDNDLLDYALSDQERTDIAGLSDGERVRAFFMYWSRKEAMMKATGLGLKLPLGSMTVSPPGAPPALLTSTDDALDPANTALADLDPGEDYAASVAAITPYRLEVTERWWSTSPGEQPKR